MLDAKPGEFEEWCELFSTAPDDDDFTKRYPTMLMAFYDHCQVIRNTRAELTEQDLLAVMIAGALFVLHATESQNPPKCMFGL